VPRSEITDEHAARIAEISTLQELHVPDTVTIGGLVWKSLGKLRLKVASSKPSDEAHTAFAGMPTLTDLQTPVTNNTQLNLYKDHPALERLSAKDSFVDDDGIKILITLQKLRQLDIKGCKITADGFEQLKKSLAKCRIESDHGTYVPAAEMVLTQRDAAEQLILKGASIQVHSKGQTYKSLPLPKGNIDVRSVEFFLKEELEDADLTLLKSFPKLEELRIANCKKLTDEGFRNLETLTSLRKLDLRGSGSAGAVDSIAKLTELQHLKCPDGMTSSAVEKLRPLKKLQTLEVGTSANLDDGLAALKELPELTQVDFHASGVTDKGAAILAEVLTLEVVRMHPTRVNMEGWRYLAKLPKLRVVHAQNFLNNLADIHQVFAEIKTLEKIEGKESSVTAKQLAFFKDHPSLKEIKLQWDSTDDQVPILLSMKALSVLTIKDTKITPAGFEQLKKGLPTCHIISDHGNYVPKAPRANDQEIAEWVLSRKGRVGIEGELSQFVDIKELPKREMTIRSVSLGKSYGDGKLVDADLAKLAGLKSIGYLSLSGAKNITDDGLQHLAGLTSLTWLDVSDCPKISGKGNVHLAKLTKLQTLGVCAQSDDDLTPILGLKGVYQLFLNKTKITAAGLAKIQAALPDLKVLHLDDVPLDDASVVEFGRMMNLTGLIITRTKITPAGFEQLKKAMPNCRIESDHGTHVPTKAK
jgi:Leucine-rich repeat (LRR) protein